MWKSGDSEELGRALSDWSEANQRAGATIFTRNIVLNSIVSDASARAEALGIRFDAEVTVSEDTGIRVEDLCTLLMNMLDNAIEAASKVEDGYIKLRINERGGFLAVSCENSFDGRVVLDDSGRCLSTKSDAEGHGFGFTQMSAAAAKYSSIIDVSWTGSVFSVQTALRLRKGQ